MTFSIVAKDPFSGELGVAVQSHWFSVGSVVPWARAGVGAVATQANAEVYYGPLGLELMASGKSARESLKALLAVDEDREVRQVAMVDNNGGSAVHTGSRCGPVAGHFVGNGFTCQANLMKNDKIWQAMAKAFVQTKRKSSRSRDQSGPSLFAEKLVGALTAGQAAGGDIRGKQSAAILTVSGEPSNSIWKGKLVELRVEDNPEPIPELVRLLRIHRGYEWADKGDQHLVAKDFRKSLHAYRKAASIAPEIEELQFWQAVSLVQVGKLREAKPIFRRIFKKNKDWLSLARMLPSLKHLPQSTLEDFV
jgi:uncharacterized Ntn-hydrolase superfamily protein